MAENEKTKNPIYKKWWFWLIVVIIVIGIGSSANENTQPTSSNPTSNISATDEAKPVEIEYIKISTDELDSELEQNAAAAKDKYKGKYVEVTGKLGVIDSDLQYISLYSINNKFDLVGMNCYIKNNEQKEIVKSLSKDDTIVVKGKITDVGEVLGYSLDITEIVK